MVVNYKFIERPLGLISGHHGTFDEIQFVSRVVHENIKPLFSGPISVVGGRGENPPRWISQKKLRREVHPREDLTSEEIDDWAKRLNSIAQANQIDPKHLPVLISKLPIDIPAPIVAWVKRGDFVVSDFDLLLHTESWPKLLKHNYQDSKTGQVVDIFIFGDNGEGIVFKKELYENMEKTA